MDKEKSKNKPSKKTIRPSRIFIFGNSYQTLEFDMMLSPRFNFNSDQLIREAQSPRDADVLLVFGRINHKSISILKRIYEQMNGPKWVIHAPSAPIADSYCVVDDLSEHIPVDLYINKINPSPIDIWNSIMELV